MSAIVDSSQNIKKEKNIISPFIIISLCALTLSIFSLLILIIYINYRNERIVDIRAISEQYHTIIQKVIKEANLESDINSYKELLEGKNLVIDGEYNVYVPNEHLYNNTVRVLKKRFFETGIGVETTDNQDDKLTSFLLKLNGVKIAKLNLRIKKSQDENRNKISEEDNEIYSVVKNILLNKYVSKTEMVEHLPEPISDGNNMWFCKRISLFLSPDTDDKIVLGEIKKLILEKFPLADIKTAINNEKNITEHNVYMNNKQLITIEIHKFSENRLEETTSSIKTSLSMQYPFDKYIEEYFAPVLFNDNQKINENVNEETYKIVENSSAGNKRKQKPQIAIILDDGGFRNPEEDPALELPNKINISILPDTRYTRELTEKAISKGFEVMLHMPMQTKQGIKKGSFPCEILVTMSEKEIQENTKKALEQIPGVKGVNNHTGGVFTLKEESLRGFMKVLKEKKIFFVDSVVIPGSKAYQIAKEEGVNTLQRDIFLDHEYSVSKIKESLEALKKIALKKGKAIGIGHFRDLTVKTLQEELPKLEEQGFELVHVSELFK